MSFFDELESHQRTTPFASSNEATFYNDNAYLLNGVEQWAMFLKPLDSFLTIRANILIRGLLNKGRIEKLYQSKMKEESLPKEERLSLKEYMYSRADLIITPTPYSKALIESYGFQKKVIAVSNGIDLKEYAPNPAAQAAFRIKFDLKEGEKFVMGVGFPFERKGIQDFFEVARDFPAIKFIWFGHLSGWITNDKVKRWVKKRPANAIML